jgi:hypothetical protein
MTGGSYPEDRYRYPSFPVFPYLNSANPLSRFLERTAVQTIQLDEIGPNNFIVSLCLDNLKNLESFRDDDITNLKIRTVRLF